MPKIYQGLSKNFGAGRSPGGGGGGGLSFGNGGGPGKSAPECSGKGVQESRDTYRPRDCREI